MAQTGGRDDRKRGWKRLETKEGKGTCGRKK